MNIDSAIVARFQLEACFQLTNRAFFLCGEILSGELRRGDFLDLTPTGIPKQIRIVEIEFIRKNKDGEVGEITGLGTYDLNEAEETHLKQIHKFREPLIILGKQ
ncbi:MAG: hypothetical protein ACO1N0_05340 [Fluviicola sp.]